MSAPDEPADRPRTPRTGAARSGTPTPGPRRPTPSDPPPDTDAGSTADGPGDDATDDDTSDAAEPTEPTGAPRPLYTTGGLAAATSAAVGLALLTTLTLVGWVAAPQANLGEDIAEVFQVAVQAWLVGHLVGFAIPGGHISLLPLGLVVLPGLLLYRSGRWLARACDLPRLRNVWQAALAIASPYAAIAGTLALVGQTDSVQPSMLQALAAGFGVAFVSGGLGALRQQLVDKDIARRRLLRLMPARARSLLVGTSTATTLLLLSGLLLFLAGLAVNIDEAATVTATLEPGVVGGILLVVVQLLYLPNAVVFGMAYAAGPGFAVGAETAVAPTGVVLGPIPAFPILAALPETGPAPVPSLVALAAPFVAGGVAGYLTLRTAPTLVSEAAPMWGFVCGLCTGAVCGLLALIAGGPLGAERMAVVGPSPWQVGLVLALEVGLSAAIVGWVTNWLHHRRLASAALTEGGGADPDAPATAADDTVSAAETDAPTGSTRRPAGPRADPAPAARPVPAGTPDPPLDPEPSPATVATPAAASQSAEPVRRRRWGWLRWPTAPSWPRRRAAAEDDPEELFGISYEARDADGAPAETEPVAPVTYLADRRRDSER